MELHIKSSFECVYLINGEFFERADCLKMSEIDVVYVTVLPIKHTLLPYTVKLCGAENVHSELFDGYRLDDGNYLLTLFPRYMTVYATTQKPVAAAPSLISRLFSLVKSGDLTAAYSMLSEELRASLGKSDLNAFFADYDRLEECTWEAGSKFFLIDKNGVAHKHAYTVKDEFIDNIIELE